MFHHYKTGSMKKLSILIFFFCIILHKNTLMAQVPAVPPVTSGKVNAGSLLTQFTNAIKPSSFLDSWKGEKGNWLSSAGKITEAAGLAKSVGSLAGFIKPGMFKQGFNLQSLLSAANTAKTMADATGLLKNLEGGLKPEAMTSGWAGKRSGWLNALSLLK